MLAAMNDGVAVKVLIVKDDGLYLAGTAFDWEFTDDRSKARVFDYQGDRVEERIELVRKAQVKEWVAMRVDPREVYEYCDQCGRRMRALRTFFDGQRFLCGDCRDGKRES